ncbi:hypothetical protein LTR95_003788 [Oleoguttula sp. CCFEE 5521]
MRNTYSAKSQLLQTHSLISRSSAQRTTADVRLPTNSTLVAGHGLFESEASNDEMAAVMSNAVAQILLAHTRETNHLQRLYSRWLRRAKRKARVSPLSSYFYSLYERNARVIEDEAAVGWARGLILDRGSGGSVLVNCWVLDVADRTAEGVAAFQGCG